MSEAPRPPPTITRVNNQGLVEVVDLFTGKVLCVQSSGNTDDYIKSKFDNLVEIDTEQGKVFIERTLDPRLLSIGKDHRRKPQFSLTWAELLYGLIVEGHTLTHACLKLDLPLAMVNRWRKQDADFEAIIAAAKLARAETLQDEALTVARDHSAKRPDLHVHTAMEQSRLSDPAQYNPKNQVDHNHSGEIAHTFIIETGIRRNQPQLAAEFDEAIRDASPANVLVAGEGKTEDDLALPEFRQVSPYERVLVRGEEKEVADKGAVGPASGKDGVVAKPAQRGNAPGEAPYRSSGQLFEESERANERQAQKIGRVRIPDLDGSGF